MEVRDDALVLLPARLAVRLDRLEVQAGVDLDEGRVRAADRGIQALQQLQAVRVPLGLGLVNLDVDPRATAFMPGVDAHSPDVAGPEGVAIEGTDGLARDILRVTGRRGPPLERTDAGRQLRGQVQDRVHHDVVDGQHTSLMTHVAPDFETFAAFTAERMCTRSSCWPML